MPSDNSNKYQASIFKKFDRQTEDVTFLTRKCINVCHL